MIRGWGKHKDKLGSRHMENGKGNEIKSIQIKSINTTTGNENDDDDCGRAAQGCVPKKDIAAG